jgi:hypothetical protein
MDDPFVCQIAEVQPICNFTTINSNLICENASVLMASRNSVSLWDGRSEDLIPVGARFSASVQTGPAVQPTSYTMGTA